EMDAPGEMEPRARQRARAPAHLVHPRAGGVHDDPAVRTDAAARERVAQGHLTARDLDRLDVVHAQRARRVRPEHGLEHEARVTGLVLDEGGGAVEARAVERRLPREGLLAAPHRVPPPGRARGDALEGPDTEAMGGARSTSGSRAAR